MIVEHLKTLLTVEDKASDKFKQAAQALNQVGEKLERVASAAGMASAAITAAATVAVNEAAKYDRRVKGAVDSLSHAYSALSVEIGRALVPTLKALASTVSTVVRYFQSLPSGVKEAIAGFAAFAASALAVVAVGAKIGGIFAKLAPILLPILPTLAMVAAALAAIVVVVGLVQEAWDSNFGGIREITAGVVEFVTTAWDDFFGWFEDATKGPASAFREMADGIASALLWPVQKALEGWAEIFKLIPGMKKMGEALAGAAKSVQGMREKGLEGLLDFGKKLGDGIVTGAKRGFKTIKSLMGASGAAIGASRTIADQDEINRAKQEDYQKKAEKAYAEKEYTKEFMKRDETKMLNGEGSAFQNFQMALDQTAMEFDVVQEHLSKFAGPLEKIRAPAEALADKLGVSVDVATAAITRWNRAVDEASKAQRQAAIDQGKGQVAGAVDSAAGGVISGAMTGGLPGAILALVQQAESFGELLGEVTALVKIVADMLNPLIDIVRPFINVLGNVLKILSPVVTLFLRLTTPLLMLAQVALPVFFELIKTVGIVLLYVAQAVASVWNGIISAFQWMVNGIGDALSGIPGVKDALKKFADSLESLKDKTDYQAEITKLQNMTLEEATESIAKETKERDKLNGSLLNAPSGYKVANARFGASNTGSSGMGDPFKSVVTGTPNVFNFDVRLDSKAIAATVIERNVMSGQANTGARWGLP